MAEHGHSPLDHVIDHPTLELPGGLGEVVLPRVAGIQITQRHQHHPRHVERHVGVAGVIDALKKRRPRLEMRVRIQLHREVRGRGKARTLRERREDGAGRRRHGDDAGQEQRGDDNK